MTNKETLKSIVQNNKNCYMNILKKEYPNIIEWINKSTPLLSDKYFNLKTKIYWILNDLKEFPICKKCKKEIRKNVESLTIGYHETCSVKCASNMKKRIDSIKRTCLKKYGVSNYSKTSEYVKKSKKTCLEKYGVEYSFQSENNRIKSKNTCIKRYGVENPMQCDDIKESSRKTCLEKYGVDNVFKDENIKRNIRKTNFEKYGVDHPMKSKYFRKRISKCSRNLRLCDSWDNNILKDEYSEPCFTKDFFLKNYNKDFEFEFKCKKCGNTFKSRHYDGCHGRCNKCFPNTSSVGEFELYNFISSVYKGKILRNSKEIIKPYELDVYVEDRKIAFEFDGLYWHSFQLLKQKNENIDRFYHMRKTEMCEEKGITLIHVFEDEWNMKREIVKSRIMNLLGLNTKTVFARKCTVRKIESDISKKFLDENHIQGNVNAPISLGLFSGDEMVSIMTFGKKRIALGSKDSKSGEYELLRYCSKLGYHVIGGAGKLLRHFERNYSPKNIISYADRRWSNGNLYEKLGFSYVHTSVPNYWYMDKQCLVRLHRFGFMKCKLKHKLKNFDKKLSEKKNMENNGYKYIYDCGNMLFEKKY